MDWITLTGIAASACTATASIPQLVKIVRSKKAEDISLIMVTVLIAGLGLWVYYGVLKKDIIIIIANSIHLLVNSGIAVLALKYKSRK